jgi:hypothetical protein
MSSLTKVKHSKWGFGIVKASRLSGYELLVQFENGLEFWLKRNELEFFERTPKKVSEKPKEEGVLLQVERRVLEALRIGIVPVDYVQNFTLGREKELSALREWLDSEQNVVFIEGEYGSGKTHTCHYLEQIALLNDFGVCFVTLDPNVSPLYSPKKVFTSCMLSFKVILGKELRSFRDFLDFLSRKEIVTGNPYFDFVLNRLKNDPDSLEYTADWLIGLDVDPSFLGEAPRHYDYSTAANIYCNLFSTVAYTLKSLKKKGLLIIFDEAENVRGGFLSSSQQGKSDNFLNGLIRVAEKDGELLTERVRYEDGCYRGVKTHLPYSAREREIRYRCSDSYHLKLAFAFTPSIGDYYLKGRSLPLSPLCNPYLGRVRHIKLNPLERENFKAIAQRVLSIYEKVYGTQQTDGNEVFEKLEGKLISLNTRMFIKGVIEILDYARLNPNKGVSELD